MTGKEKTFTLIASQSIATTTSLDNTIFCKGCLEADEYIPCPEVDFILVVRA